jgi:hypothetical protein
MTANRRRIIAKGSFVQFVGLPVLDAGYTTESSFHPEPRSIQSNLVPKNADLQNSFSFLHKPAPDEFKLTPKSCATCATDLSDSFANLTAEALNSAV